MQSSQVCACGSSLPNLLSAMLSLLGALKLPAHFLSDLHLFCCMAGQCGLPTKHNVTTCFPVCRS